MRVQFARLAEGVRPGQKGEAAVAQQMEQQVHLQMLRHFIDELCHGLGRVGAAANLDGFGRLLELVSQGFDFPGQGGAEEQRLAPPRQRADDAAN